MAEEGAAWLSHLRARPALGLLALLVVVSLASYLGGSHLAGQHLLQAQAVSREREARLSPAGELGPARPSPAPEEGVGAQEDSGAGEPAAEQTDRKTG